MHSQMKWKSTSWCPNRPKIIFGSLLRFRWCCQTTKKIHTILPKSTQSLQKSNTIIPGSLPGFRQTLKAWPKPSGGIWKNFFGSPQTAQERQKTSHEGAQSTHAWLSVLAQRFVSIFALSRDSIKFHVYENCRKTCVFRKFFQKCIASVT